MPCPHPAVTSEEIENIAIVVGGLTCRQDLPMMLRAGRGGVSNQTRSLLKLDAVRDVYRPRIVGRPRRSSPRRPPPETEAAPIDVRDVKFVRLAFARPTDGHHHPRCQPSRPVTSQSARQRRGRQGAQLRCRGRPRDRISRSQRRGQAHYAARAAWADPRDRRDGDVRGQALRGA